MDKVGSGADSSLLIVFREFYLHSYTFYYNLLSISNVGGVGKGVGGVGRV